MPKLRGMAASRRGSPAIGLQTLIDRVTRRVKKAAPVSVEEAERAAQVLQHSRGRGARYRDAVLAGSTLRPFVRAAGSAVEAGLTAPRGQRLRAAVHGAGDVKGLRSAFTKPRLARDVVEGGIGGAVINAGREGLEVGRAKRQAAAFLGDTGVARSKLAAELDRSLNVLGRRIQPLRTSKLAPIMDEEVEFEV